MPSLRKIFEKLWLVTVLSVEQFSVWVKHYYAVSFLPFGSYSAHFLDFKLDSAQTESQGSERSLRPILRPALCGHAYRRGCAVFFSSNPAVSSSIFVGTERRENLIRNDPDKSEFTNFYTVFYFKTFSSAKNIFHELWASLDDFLSFESLSREIDFETIIWP